MRIEKRKLPAFVLCILLILNLTACDLSTGQSNQGTEVSKEATVDRTTKEAKAEQAAFDDWCETQFVDTLNHLDTISLHYFLKEPEAYGARESEIGFGELSREDTEESVRENQKVHRELQDFRYELLGDQQQMTYDVMDSYLSYELDLAGYTYYGNLLSPTLGIPANIPVSLAEFPFACKEDVTTYLTLLTKLPDYFSQLAKYEKEVAEAGLFISDETLEKTVKQMRDFIENPQSNYLITTFPARLTEIEGLSQQEKNDFCKQNENHVTEYIIPAYEQLAEKMEGLKGSGINDGGLCHFEKGKDYYERLVQYYTLSDMSVAEMEKKLKLRMNEIMKRIKSIVLEHPNAYEEYDQISYSITEPEEIVSFFQEAMKDYFPEPANVTYTIKYVDESLAESLSPAFYMIPQIDNYENNVIYINDKSSHYDVQNLVPTLAHESFPGHLYQTTYYDSRNLNPIRQLFNLGGYSEGWATYVEIGSYELYDYGEEDEAITDLLQMEAEFSLCLSCIADIGVNYNGWDKTKLQYFLNQYNMGDHETVQQVFDLVVEDPGNYLQYYVSYLEFRDLRNDTRAQLRDDFSVKEFHKALLGLGPAPFSVLEKRMQQYIDFVK